MATASSMASMASMAMIMVIMAVMAVMAILLLSYISSVLFPLLNETNGLTDRWAMSSDDAQEALSSRESRPTTWQTSGSYQSQTETPTA